MATAVGLLGGSTLHGVTDDQKRWVVFGIALSKILVTQIRPFVEQEAKKEYVRLTAGRNIHTQSTSGRLKNWRTFLKYENINGNDALPRLPGGRYDYSKFDCRVTSHVDFAKLYVENHMAKFNAFDEHCDASAMLALLGKVPVFSLAVQSAAGDVRQARNAWAHCVFSDWDPVNYQQRFVEMENLAKALGLTPAVERDLLGELKDWETKGTILCMNPTVDPDLLNLVQQHVNTLRTDEDQLTFEVQEDRERVSRALNDMSTSLEELQARIASVQYELEARMAGMQCEQEARMASMQCEQEARMANVQCEQEDIKQEQSSLSNKVDALQTDVETRQEDVNLLIKSQAEQEDVNLLIKSQQEDVKLLKSQQEDVQQRVAHVEDQLSSAFLQENREDGSYEGPANVVSQQYHSNVSVEIASFEADIAFFAKRHDPDTRQWLFDDFDAWFRVPGDSRAYVLLGDPGVGKSVLAAVLAQRTRGTGHLGAAYFCRHNNGTRNDPRYLLGTIASQLCDCNTQYKAIVGGEGGVKMLLSNSKLRVRELFTKLLQEPLSKCPPSQQRKLVIIDALDETEYESREDFLDLIMHRFPLLPEWLVFFITSRPEDTVQCRLKKYNPCVKICAGNSDQHNFYHQHEQDIQTFLKKRIDFSPLPYSVDDISKKCHGLFLYAHYIVEELKLSVDSGKKLNPVSDLFPGDIDDFFRQNFERVYEQVEQDIFKRLFGCAIVAPSPLPVSIISYILMRENSDRDEQQVIDAVSQFVVLRTSDQTLTFLHNLIPAWLTDKKKSSRKLFIDKKIAGECLRKVFVEILSAVVDEPPSTCTSIDVDLEDYVSRFGVRFLCQFGGKDSLKTVFSCLTSYHFMERRMLSRRIEIYHLLEDFKLAAGCLPVEGKEKQEILQDISFGLERNVLVLLECPHLLHSCIRNASKAVRETVLIPHVSAPWLEWNVYAFPDPEIGNMHCFATSSDKKTVAGAKGRSLLFFDASTAETVRGPFEISGNTIDKIDQLEFSPDGKFLFFGRLDKWFSVERGCVEDFSQFSGKSHIYKWGVFTRGGNCIVVKWNWSYNQITCQSKSCLVNLLALWAVKEIEHSRDDEMTVCFNRQVQCNKPIAGVQITRLLQRLGLGTILNRSCETHFSYDPTCSYCSRLRELTESNQESSLETVRQLIIELYPDIFQYQVWDLQSGMPVLHQVFLQSVQFDPFTYLCHMTCNFNLRGLKLQCDDIDKAMSVCNVAVTNAVCCALFGRRFSLERRRELEQKCMHLRRQVLEWVRVWVQVWVRVQAQKRKMTPMEKLVQELKQELKWDRKWDLKWQLVQKLMRELEWKMEELEEKDVERMVEEEVERAKRLSELERELEREREREREWERKQELERELELELARERERELELELERELELLQLKVDVLVSPELIKKFDNEAFEFEVCINIPKAFQDLVNKINGDILICMSPQRKWILEADSFLKMCVLSRGDQEKHSCNYGKPEHKISEVVRFTFTNDDLYFVYSSEDSLHALSLQTGTIFTSVSGCNLFYFTRERQVGYLFRSGTEEIAILLSNLFSPFTFFKVSPVKPSVVGKSITAVFCPSDTVISVSSDSMVTLWKTTEDQGISFISKSSLTMAGQQESNVKNCVFSTDGKLMAIHQGTKIQLYSFAESGLKTEFLYTVFEAECELLVTCFTFSADSTSLLLCIQDSGNDQHFYVWDVQEKVMSASFKSPTFLTVECCCCLSSSTRELILCGEYEIEIWEYTKPSCRLLTRLAVERPATFSQCTISLDNQLLVCCIADTILVYSPHDPDVNSSKRVLRGHLGRIEFCRFLKLNRYLISYGVDGMVFLWDISESKAVGFATIAQGKESIVSMAVSPEEDKVVCFTSSGRVCIIKLCELGCSLSLKPLIAPVEDKMEIAETSLQLPEQIASTSQIQTSPVEHDTTESLSSSDFEEEEDWYCDIWTDSD